MKRRIPLFPLMIGVSLAFHGMALLLLPGLRGSSPLPAAAKIPVFSLVNIEVPAAVPAAALPKPPVTAVPPPAPAAGYPAGDEVPPPAALPRAASAETAVPAAVPAAAPAAPAVAPEAARGAGQNTAQNAAAGAERRALVTAYTRRSFDYIQRRIREKLVYPPQARRTGAQGRAEAAFTVYPDGSIGGLEILTSSGQESLDQALIDAIRAAAPFPPPPVQARLVMPLTFRLK